MGKIVSHVSDAGKDALVSRKNKRGFVIPKLGLRAQRQRGFINGRISEAMVAAGNAEQRIIDNTPTLKRLKEFLARPVP